MLFMLHNVAFITVINQIFYRIFVAVFWVFTWFKFLFFFSFFFSILAGVVFFFFFHLFIYFINLLILRRFFIYFTFLHWWFITIFFYFIEIWLDNSFRLIGCRYFIHISLIIWSDISILKPTWFWLLLLQLVHIQLLQNWCLAAWIFLCLSLWLHCLVSSNLWFDDGFANWIVLGMAVHEHLLTLRLMLLSAQLDWCIWLVKDFFLWWALIFVFLVLCNVLVLMLDEVSFLCPAYWTFGTNLPLGAIPAHFAHLSRIFETCDTCPATSSAGALEHIHCHSWSHVGLVRPLFLNRMYLPIFINSKSYRLCFLRFLRWPIVYPLFLLIHLGNQFIN